MQGEGARNHAGLGRPAQRFGRAEGRHPRRVRRREGLGQDGERAGRFVSRCAREEDRSRTRDGRGFQRRRGERARGGVGEAARLRGRRLACERRAVHDDSHAVGGGPTLGGHVRAARFVRRPLGGRERDDGAEPCVPLRFGDGTARGPEQDPELALPRLDAGAHVDDRLVPGDRGLIERGAQGGLRGRGIVTGRGCPRGRGLTSNGGISRGGKAYGDGDPRRPVRSKGERRRA